MDKMQLRQQIARRKKELTIEERKGLSESILQKLVDTDLFKVSRRIALYYPMSGEVDTRGLIENWSQRKEFALPVVKGNDIQFFLYQGKEFLRAGAFGIMEPDEAIPVAPRTMDLVIVPGIAFDCKLNRMGRGKGYYDRFLQEIQAPTIGVCFDFQLFEEIPTEPHDIKMSMVVTEKVIIR